MDKTIALSHAGSLAAEAVLEKLSESGVKPDSLVLLDHESQAGKRVAYGGTHLVLADQLQADMSDCALLLLLQDAPDLEAIAVQQGCLVVGHAIDDDETALFLAPGFDEPAISYSASRLRLVGAEAACVLPALTALDRLGGVADVHLTVMRSAEFYGKAGVEELASQTVSLLNSREIESSVFPQQIAFNLLPREADPQVVSDIARFLLNRDCLPSLHSVDVPVFHGFAVAVQVGFESECDLTACKQALSRLDKVEIQAADSGSIFDCNQSFSCAISHLRQASGTPSNLQFWMIADPLRYGLANNYVNVVDFLLKSFL